VTLLGERAAPLVFQQSNSALIVTLPPGLSKEMPYVLRIEGLMPFGA